LNPSRQEFLDQSGAELDGPRRRFETLSSLRVTTLETAPSAAIQRVLAACEGYFARNPYRRWFDQLEPVLRTAGGSYYEGSACHLDLVQWATDPTWAKLAEHQRDRLLSEDVDFLQQQLKHSRIRTLLLNGRAVLTAFEEAFNMRLTPTAAVQRTEFFTGSLSSVHVVGWSTNIQSSFGVSNDLRTAIAARVGELSDRLR
jgi:hypothetical protein